MKTDGQILYEAFRSAGGGEDRWQDWAQLSESTRICWEETALAMEKHFSVRMLAKLGRMAAK
jgi:hypothetical protein